MYARNQQYKYSKEPVTGGQPITVGQAKVSGSSSKCTYFENEHTRICSNVFVEYIYFVLLCIVRKMCRVVFARDMAVKDLARYKGETPNVYISI